MKSVHVASIAVFLAGVLAGCADRAAGNTLETENAVAIRIDTLLSSPPQGTDRKSVGVLRLGAHNFAFERVGREGRELDFRKDDGAPVPFRIVFWDSAAALARIEIGLDSSLLRPQARLWMLWNQPSATRSDSSAVWSDIALRQRSLLSSVLVSDFEYGSLRSLLPEPTNWYSVPSESTSISKPEVVADSLSWSGGVLRVRYAADSTKFRNVVLGLSLGSRPRVLRSMDSLVLRMRGSGRVSIALDRLYLPNEGKAWLHLPIAPTWKRVVVRPQDFLPAGGVGKNIGWEGVRDSVTNLTFLLTGGSEFYVDDIRIHGMDANDFR